MEVEVEVGWGEEEEEEEEEVEEEEEEDEEEEEEEEEEISPSSMIVNGVITPDFFARENKFWTPAERARSLGKKEVADMIDKYKVRSGIECGVWCECVYFSCFCDLPLSPHQGPFLPFPAPLVVKIEKDQKIATLQINVTLESFTKRLQDLYDKNLVVEFEDKVRFSFLLWKSSFLFGKWAFSGFYFFSLHFFFFILVF